MRRIGNLYSINKVSKTVQEKGIQGHLQLNKLKDALLKPLSNEDGLGIVEIALIIIIIIGLAFMFKEEVEAMLEGLFDAMEYSEFVE